MPPLYIREVLDRGSFIYEWLAAPRWLGSPILFQALLLLIWVSILTYNSHSSLSVCLLKAYIYNYAYTHTLIDLVGWWQIASPTKIISYGKWHHTFVLAPRFVWFGWLLQILRMMVVNWEATYTYKINQEEDLAGLYSSSSSSVASHLVKQQCNKEDDFLCINKARIQEGRSSSSSLLAWSIDRSTLLSFSSSTYVYRHKFTEETIRPIEPTLSIQPSSSSPNPSFLRRMMIYSDDFGGLLTNCYSAFFLLALSQSVRPFHECKSQ